MTTDKAKAFRADFGMRVLLLRKTAGLNQAGAAIFLGYSNGNGVSRLERGKPDVIAFDILQGLIALARESGLDANWLFAGPLLPGESNSGGARVTAGGGSQPVRPAREPRRKPAQGETA